NVFLNRVILSESAKLKLRPVFEASARDGKLPSWACSTAGGTTGLGSAFSLDDVSLGTSGVVVVGVIGGVCSIFAVDVGSTLLGGGISVGTGRTSSAGAAIGCFTATAGDSTGMTGGPETTRAGSVVTGTGDVGSFFAWVGN